MYRLLTAVVSPVKMRVLQNGDPQVREQ